MSDRNQTEEQSVEDADNAADLKAIVVVFVCLVAMAAHMASGFTFQF